MTIVDYTTTAAVTLSYRQNSQQCVAAVLVHNKLLLATV